VIPCSPEKAVTGVGIPALGIYKPSVIFGNSNTPSCLHYVFPAVQWVLPSRYHSIHKNELARAMFEGTQRSLGAASGRLCSWWKCMGRAAALGRRGDR
jgi:hypothetical protein